MPIGLGRIRQWLPELQSKAGLGVAGLGGLAFVITSLITIGGAGRWILSWLSPGPLPALIVRDLRSESIQVQKTADGGLEVLIATEAVVSNSGGQLAKNCFGGLVFDGFAYDAELQSSYVADVRDTAATYQKDISYPANAEPVVVRFWFDLLPAGFAQTATFRIECDNAITDFQKIEFPKLPPAPAPPPSRF
jgi:hypothetical protein